MQYKKYILTIIVGLIMLVASIAGGYVWGLTVEKKVLTADLNIIHPLRDHTASYKFISPLLAYVIPPADQEENLTILKNNISHFINEEKKSNGLSDTSLFFYDLNRGRWMG